MRCREYFVRSHQATAAPQTIVESQASSGWKFGGEIEVILFGDVMSDADGLKVGREDSDQQQRKGKSQVSH